MRKEDVTHQMDIRLQQDSVVTLSYLSVTITLDMAAQDKVKGLRSMGQGLAL